jgi:hypothetical protein
VGDPNPPAQRAHHRAARKPQEALRRVETAFDVTGDGSEGMAGAHWCP